MARKKGSSTRLENSKDRNNYYVYAYKNRKTGTIIYVGVATGNRGEDLQKHFKNNLHLYDIYLSDGLKYQVLERSLSKQDSRELEKKLIEELKPECNIRA